MIKPSAKDIAIMDKLLQFECCYIWSQYIDEDFEKELGFARDSDEHNIYKDLLIEFNRDEYNGKLFTIMDERTTYESIECNPKTKKFINDGESIEKYYKDRELPLEQILSMQRLETVEPSMGTTTHIHETHHNTITITGDNAAVNQSVKSSNLEQTTKAKIESPSIMDTIFKGIKKLKSILKSPK
jgi:hypothetical protein